MKNFVKRTGFLIFLSILSAFSLASAQKLSGTSVKVTVGGTSTLHAWTMTSTKAAFSGQLSGNSIKDIRFRMHAKDLKSGKASMDTNTYKALKADRFPDITFAAKQMALNKTHVVGVLSVAGVSKTVSLPLSVDRIGATYNLNGIARIQMSDFGIAPPNFLMNTVKTGDDITLSVNIVAK